MARARSARPRGGIAFALAAGCLLLSVPGWASAATAPIEDPIDPVKDTVTKTVDSVLDPVRETAKPVTDAVEEATQPVRKPVEDATRAVTDTVKEATDPVPDVLDPVTDVVDPGPEVTDPVTQDPEPGTRIEGVVPGRGDGPSRNGREQAPARRTRLRQPAPAGPQRGTGGAAGLDALLRQSLREAPAATPPATREPAQPARSAVDAVREAALEASRAFRFPLLLAAAMLLFLGIQARLDARDPKLAAPAVDEELTFA